jgi:hypothetical protein
LGQGFDLIRFNPTSLHGFLVAGKDFCRIIPRKMVIKKFLTFIKQNLHLTPHYSKHELENGIADYYDYYITGSDQIWNPTCISSNNILDPIYLLSFAPDSAHKSAFSSSAGGHTFTDDENEKLKKYLSRFENISVREKDTKEVLQSLLDREITHTLDPTLLLSCKEWSLISRPPKNIKLSEKYILLYTVPKVKLVRELVGALSKRLNYKIISLDQGLTAGAKVDKQIRDAGPGEYIYLFENAEFIITDSFHGACFSINYSKPFISISQGSKGSTRIKSLLHLLGLEERFISNIEELANLDLQIDYDEPMLRLESERRASFDLLTNIFK